jgi:NAD(P)H-hydrate epimerase
MLGAASLVSRSAMRSGAGYALLGVPAADPDRLPVSEAVGVALPAVGWEAHVVTQLDRCQALVVGPGLGRSETTTAAVRALVAQAEIPTVVDADGLHALGGPDEARSVLPSRPAPTILTPHAGEFARLAGRPVSDDPVADARSLAEATATVVLLKGPTTVVANPAGEVLLVTSGSPRLATAGTGDVLSGVIGAFLAAGLDPFRAAAFAGHVHGAASRRGHAVGLVASDLHDLLAEWLSDAMERRR